MMLSLSDEEFDLIVTTLRAYAEEDEPSRSLVERMDALREEQSSPDMDKFRDAARDRYLCHQFTDGDIDFDGADELVSASESGAYVAMWGWVTNEQAGVEEEENEPEKCITCGVIEGSSEWGTVGDGFNGECPSCADKTEATRNGS